MHSLLPFDSRSCPLHAVTVCFVVLQVAVLYASDYGFSDRLSQTIARGITKANVAVEMLDLLSADPQVRPQ